MRWLASRSATETSKACASRTAGILPVTATQGAAARGDDDPQALALYNRLAARELSQHTQLQSRNVTSILRTEEDFLIITLL